jgi:hypothetical protein
LVDLIREGEVDAIDASNITYTETNFLYEQGFNLIPEKMVLGRHLIKLFRFRVERP